MKAERHIQEEDVLSTFDPYGTNVYKGMKVGDDHLQTELEIMSKKGEKVGFKKRKKMGTSATKVVSEADSSLSTSNTRFIEGDVKIKLEKFSDEKDPILPSFALSQTEKICESQVYIKSEIKVEASVKVELSVEEQAIMSEKVEERKRMAEKISFNFGGPRRRR